MAPRAVIMLGVLVVALLIVSSEVTARELTEETSEPMEHFPCS